MWKWLISCVSFEDSLDSWWLVLVFCFECFVVWVESLCILLMLWVILLII